MTKSTGKIPKGIFTAAQKTILALLAFLGIGVSVLVIKRGGCWGWRRLWTTILHYKCSWRNLGEVGAVECRGWCRRGSSHLCTPPSHPLRPCNERGSRKQRQHYWRGHPSLARTNSRVLFKEMLRHLQPASISMSDIRQSRRCHRDFVLRQLPSESAFLPKLQCHQEWMQKWVSSGRPLVLVPRACRVSVLFCSLFGSSNGWLYFTACGPRG